MNTHAALRIAAGIALGLGLASLPFLHYGLEGRHAALSRRVAALRDVAHSHHH